MRRHFAVLAALAFSGFASADPVAWDVTGQNQFGSLDLSNGNFAPITTFPFIAAGLGVDGGSVYTAVEGGLGLYSVSQTNGALTLVGNSSISYFAFGSTANGLYMLDTTGSLWTINASTGAATRIGSTLLDVVSGTPVGLSAGGDTLYVALGPSIYRINTATASSTFIGTAPTDFGALVNVAGTIYGTSIVNSLQIYNFNPTTGISAFATGYHSGDYSYGLAPVVPEPSSFMLLGLAGLLFGGYALKRKLV
ncbi:MAG: PEP-CTERM sorting domain-containing protein [Acidobacteriaceae bacterium]|nr:PEP-CTERM sorting domain-containing protein [Acidobacteriaceae bacterium]